jgi:Uma2 family endonuclease
MTPLALGDIEPGSGWQRPRRGGRISVMSATSHRHPISVAEYLRMGAAGVFSPDMRLELIEGQIIEMAPIGSPHAAVVSLLTALFIRAVGERAVVWAQNPLIVGDRSMPQPDLALLKPRSDNYFGAHPTAADVLLVVEVSDTTLRFDLDTKVPLYARAGAAETWVVDIERRALIAFRDNDGTRYGATFIVSRNDRVSVAALDGVTVEVASLFPA